MTPDPKIRDAAVEIVAQLMEAEGISPEKAILIPAVATVVSRWIRGEMTESKVRDWLRMILVVNPGIKLTETGMNIEEEMKRLEAELLAQGLSVKDQLEGEFWKIDTTDTTGKTLNRVENLADAQCLIMLCPKCFVANGGNVGTHSLQLWFDGRGVPAEQRPQSRRQVTGSSLDDISLSPSILVVGGCGWHGFVRQGKAVNA